MNDQPEEQPFRYVYSDGLGELFEQLDISLLVTTYQAGKLCTFRSRSGQIKMLPRTFKKAMGVAADPSRMAVATQHQIWFLNNEPVIGAKIEPKDTYDACYIPRRSHVTSNIDLHEIAWGRGDQLWLVNTLFSCLATLDDASSFVPRWHPPFISRLSRHDRCHLNGLAMVEGEPAYVTMFAATDTPQGWREHKLEGGLVMHVASGEVVFQGLSMPHSPRVHGGRLWVLDSGNGNLICVDTDSGRSEVVARFDGYPRGLAFCGRFAFVGLSKIREKEIFGGVPIADESRERHCGVAVVDLNGGNIFGRLEFEKSVEEIFDVQVLSGIRFPTVVGFDQDTIEKAAVIAGQPQTTVGHRGGLKQSNKSKADKAITLGLRCLRQDNLQQAASHFRKAVQFAPEYPKAHNNLCYVLLELEDIPGAIESGRQAVRYDPNYHRAHNNLGNALRTNDELERAISHYRKAIQLQPEYMLAHNNLGIALRAIGELEDARGHCEQAIRLQLDFGLAYVNLAEVLLEMGQLHDAQQTLRRALDAQPNLSVAWNRLADSLCLTGDFEESVASHDRAIEMTPNNARFHADRALSLSKAHRLEEAAQGYQDALKLEPDNVDFESDFGLVRLMMGDYSAGWKAHERRLEVVRDDGVKLTPGGEQVPIEGLNRSGPRKTEFPQRPWDGSPLKGRTLLIWGEQGIGDEFMFASMFAEVIEQAAHCVIECDHRCVELMSRSFPTAEFVGKTAPPRPRTQSADIDFQCAMGSLGYWLRPDESSFGRARPGYLKTDPALVEKLRARYAKNDVKAVVGLSWCTANKPAARQRNADLDLWREILIRPDVRFVNLQYGDHSQELECIRHKFDVEIYQDPEVDPIQDLDTFAAQIDAMDLVISIDNSTVHLAGALGKPVWTLLPYSPDWRWMLDRSDSPWYPSMRLFRQPKFGDWQSVFDDLAQEFCTQSWSNPSTPDQRRSTSTDRRNREREREREKYDKVWTFDQYRHFSPGLEIGKKLQLTDQLRAHRVRTVLDAGCGSGKLMQWLMTDYAEEFEVHGFDISAHCLDPWFADIKEEILTVGCLWDAVDFVTHYDAIICTDVLEHIPPERIPAVLANFRRCADKLCFLSIALFADHFGPELVDEPLHLSVKPPEWWYQRCTEANFKVHWKKVEHDAGNVPQWVHILLNNGVILNNGVRLD